MKFHVWVSGTVAGSISKYHGIKTGDEVMDLEAHYAKYGKKLYVEDAKE